MQGRFLKAFCVALSLTACSAVWGQSGLDGLVQKQEYEARRSSSAHEDLHRNGDGRAIAAGETLILAEMEGPGVINHIWTTVGSPDPFASRSLVLRMYWDGAEHPSVQTPLGDFFGVGHGAAENFVSQPVAVSAEGRARSCYWRMPFRKSARVTVTNESSEYRCDSFYYYVDWQKHETLPEDMPYFHAQYRQDMPAKPGDYTILETEGQGHYVGTVYSVQQVELGWFGEGDDRFYIDGESEPSLRGTGTEDYFGDAWGFRKFATPYYGVSLWEGYFPGDRGTAYRWHIEDPVPFKKSLKVSIEHRGSIFTDEAQHLGQFNERPDWLSSVAFWYQHPATQFTDPFPTVSERIAPYRVLKASDLKVQATPESAVQKDGPTVNLMPNAPDGEIAFDFDVDDPGRYQINAMIYHSMFAGVYQPFLDDKKLNRELDLCRAGHDPLWVSLDLHDLQPGTHTLRFKGTGTSPQMRSKIPPLHSFGVTYLILLRLEDMEGYREAMKERLEKVKSQ